MFVIDEVWKEVETTKIQDSILVHPKCEIHYYCTSLPGICSLWRDAKHDDNKRN
jgi:hypothetical protein